MAIFKSYYVFPVKEKLIKLKQSWYLEERPFLINSLTKNKAIILSGIRLISKLSSLLI